MTLRCWRIFVERCVRDEVVRDRALARRGLGGATSILSEQQPANEQQNTARGGVHPENYARVRASVR